MHMCVCVCVCACVRVCVCVCACVHVYSRVDIILDIEQVINHGLVGELMHKGCDHIKSSVQNDQLRLSLLGSLNNKKTRGCAELRGCPDDIAEYYRQDVR